MPEPAAAATAPPPLHWTFEPWVLACLFVSAALYAVGVARLWRRAGIGRGIPVRRTLAFAGGWLAIALALVSPLDALGSQLFSAHMLQHEVLMVVAAPLLVLARPLGAWTWALSPAWRRRIGDLTRSPAWSRPWRLLTGAASAWLLHALVLWLWHAPAAFEAALADDTVHAWQHASFLLAALLYWWSIFGAASGRVPAAALPSLFTTMVHTGALGALLTLAPEVWYPTYAARTLAFGLDPLEDQQLGGLVMWVPAGLAYVVSGLALASRWLGGRSGHAAGAGGTAVVAGAARCRDRAAGLLRPPR